MSASLVPLPAQDPRVARALWLARILDLKLLDPLIGLVLPGAGDVLTNLLGLYTVWVALAVGLPKRVIARMLYNLGVDALVGTFPGLGDLFDLAFRAHERNAQLLQAPQEWSSAGKFELALLAGGALIFILGLLVPTTLMIFGFYWLF